MVNKCEKCGRSVLSEPLTYFVEYGIWLCNDCLRQSMFSDYIPYTYKKQEERTMDYNKKKDTSIDVKRYVTREEVVTVNSLHDLEGGDKIKVMINGEVYEAKVDRRPPIDYSGEAELAIAVYIDKPLSKSWKELGYNCFEDMIDDIAKEHGSTGHKYAGEWVNEIYPGTFDGHLIAGSYRDCIISIYDVKTDKHAIINAPCATVYIPDKAKHFNDSFEDMIKEGRITSPSNYIKIHDAAHEGKKYVYADSFGKSIIRVINDDGSSTICDADRFQVYLEEDD